MTYSNKKTFNYETHFMGHGEGDGSIPECAKHYRFKRLSQVVSLQKQHILDYGCGGGIFLRTLKTIYPAIHGYGCDISKQAIDLAQNTDTTGNTYKVNTAKIPFPDAVFDIICCLDVLEHIPSYEHTMRELKRVLKRNGKIFFCIPCEGQPFTYTWLVRLWYKKFDLTNRYWGHVHPEFTHQYVLEIMKKSGFRIVDKSYGEHIFSQCFELCTYFLPKFLLEKIMGDKIASRVSDSGVTKRKLLKKSFAENFFLLVRHIWLTMTKAVGNVALYESEVLKNFSFGAWKILLLVEKV